MPIKGWDHLELYVGNAKQAAYFYAHAFGFTQTAYAGPETGVRDRASYVLDQNDVRLVLTTGLSRTARSRASRAHTATGSRTSRSGSGCERGVPPGRPARCEERHRAALGRGRVWTRRARVDRDVRREHPHVREPRRLRGAVPSRLHLDDRERLAVGRDRDPEHRPRRRERRARPHGALGRVLRAGVRDDRADPLLGRGDLDRVLGTDVEGDDGRRGEDQVPDQRAGRGQAQEPDRGVPGLLRRAGRAARGSRLRTTSSEPSSISSLAACASSRRRRRTTKTSRSASARSTRTTKTYVAWASWPTATRRGTCFRSSRRPRKTGRRSSSRSSSATARVGLGKAISRHCSRQSNESRPSGATSSERGDT